jgi:tetratricopeptide (TPR) repeat protein
MPQPLSPLAPVPPPPRAIPWFAIGQSGVGVGLLLVLATTFHSGSPLGLSELNRLHFFTLMTAWFALWLPSAGWRSVSFADLLGWSLIAALVGCCALQCHGGEVREASYYWLVLALDGALLFFVASRLNSPLGALPVWLSLNFLAVVGPLIVRNGNVYSPQQIFGNLIWVGVSTWVLGLVFWAIDRVLERNRISSRVGPFLLCLLLLTGALGARHLWLKESRATTHLQTNATFFWQKMDAAALSVLRSDVLMGGGPGALSAAFARQELALPGNAHTSVTPPRDSSGPNAEEKDASAPQNAKGTKPAPPTRAPGFFALLRPWKTASAQAWKTYVVEWGAVGTALGLTLMALLLGRACFACTWGTPAFPSARVAGYLCLWLWLLAEGTQGFALRHSYGFVLFCLFSGLLWGSTRRALQAAEETSIFDHSQLARRGILGAGALACLIGALFTCIPLWGLRRAERVAEADLALPSSATALRWAARMHPWSADICLKQARQMIAQSKAEGKTADLNLYNVEKCLRAALARNPYRDDLYAAQAELYRNEKQSYKMLRAIIDGLRRCPNSLTLSLWAIEYAQQANNEALLEMACRDAIRLSPPGSETRVRQLGRLAAFYERKGNYAYALKAAVQQVQEAPGHLEALERMRRLAVQVHAFSTP